MSHEQPQGSQESSEETTAPSKKNTWLVQEEIESGVWMDLDTPSQVNSTQAGKTYVKSLLKKNPTGRYRIIQDRGIFQAVTKTVTITEIELV